MSEYKRNPRGARRARKSMGRKAIVVLSLMMVLVMAAVGGTLAWLTATTGPVTNTFTTSDINITLAESENLDLKMVPGYTIAKDPKVTVTAGSEPCYLFVKLEKSTNFDNFLTYTMADGWTQLTDKDGANVAGVFYREIANAEAMGTPYSVLKNDQVTVLGTVTKTMMNDIDKGTHGAAKPTLTVTAYAAQLYKNNTEKFTAADAWAILNPTPAP